MPAVKKNSEMVFPNLFDRYFESPRRPREYSNKIFSNLILGARVFFQFVDDFIEHTCTSSFYPPTSRHFREIRRDSHGIGFDTLIASPGLREDCLLKKFVNESKERGEGMKVKGIVLAFPSLRDQIQCVLILAGQPISGNNPRTQLSPVGYLDVRRLSRSASSEVGRNEDRRELARGQWATLRRGCKGVAEQFSRGSESLFWPCGTTKSDRRDPELRVRPAPARAAPRSLQVGDFATCRLCF